MNLNQMFIGLGKQTVNTYRLSEQANLREQKISRIRKTCNTMTTAIAGSQRLDNPLTPKLDKSVGAKSHLFQPPPWSAASSLHSSTTPQRAPDPREYRTHSRKRTRHDTQYFMPSPSPLHTKHSTEGEEVDLDIASTKRLRRSQGTYAASHALPGQQNQDEHDECSRLPKSQNIRDGLGNVFYRFAGVANKVWQNWSTTFQGFYSGGGRGYHMRAPFEMHDGEAIRCGWAGQESRWKDNNEMPTTPGGFPQEDYIPNYWSEDPISSRPHKRNRKDIDMKSDWILVDGRPMSKEISPSSVSQKRISMSPASGKRATPRSRRQILPPPRSSFAGSPRLRSNHASYASPRSSAPASPVRDSPINADVQRHAARIRRKEAEEDTRLRQFNQQLKAMIREGKEALGTRFEVEDQMFEDLIETNENV